MVKSKRPSGLCLLRWSGLKIAVVMSMLFYASSFACALWALSPKDWIPARWDGGPLEAARRSRDKNVATNASTLEAIAEWYSPATLALLEGMPINCLLVTFSAGAEPALEGKQHQLVKEYARLAQSRGLAVLGIVYPGADPEAVVSAATEAKLDGLVLEGEFPAGTVYAEKLETGLSAGSPAGVVIPIAREAVTVRTRKAPLLAVEGVRPGARDLADMGIRAGPSEEPWIDSNIWLVRSFRLGADWRPIWINQKPDADSQREYVRCVADSAVAGGRWIVALDDELRVGLLRKNPNASTLWRNVGTYLKFAEDHAEWRGFQPYGNLAIILDTAGDTPDFSNEYLNLVARRQVPYRLIERSRLSSASLAGYRAVLGLDLATVSDTERKTLRDFALDGGLVVAGPSWGDAPDQNNYAEIPLGKGRVVVYKEHPPDPEMVAKDMLDLLEPEVIGLKTFNVPSVLTYVSTDGPGRRALIQLLNYATSPFNSKITLRLNGNFKTARLFTPEDAPLALEARAMPNGRTEISIPKLAVWGALLLE